MAEKEPLDAIDQYLWDASIRLRGISDARRARALAEAQGHLRERAAELLATPRTPDEAAADAVGRFGEMKAWTRSIVNASYLSEHAALDRWLVLGFVALAALLPSVIMSFFGLVQGFPVVPFTLISVSILGLFAAAFHGRQYLAKPSLLVGLACLPVAFVIGGVTGQIENRQAHERAYAGYQQSAQETKTDAAMLKSGLLFYTGDGWKSSVPAYLRSGSGYVVPASYWDSMGQYMASNAENEFPALPMVTWTESFTHLLPGVPIPNRDYPAGLRQYRSLERYNTAATAKQAAHIWRTQAPFWLTLGVPHAMAADEAGMRLYSDPAAPFDVVDGGYKLAFTMTCAAIALLIQLCGAALGRRVYVRRETRQHAG